MGHLIHLTGIFTIAFVLAFAVVVASAAWAGRYGPPRCYSRMLGGVAVAVVVFIIAFAAMLGA